MHAFMVMYRNMLAGLMAPQCFIFFLMNWEALMKFRSNQSETCLSFAAFLCD